MRYFLLTIFIFLGCNAFSQNELKNWYFGTGTDGLVFTNNVPQKVSNKLSGVGFEGMIVVNEPVTGNLLFYSDGEKAVNKNHAIMTNGSGLTGHFSGAQCVQSCPLPGSCSQKFYLFTNSAWDQTAGALSYSIVDFTTNPLGVVTNKNTLFWNGPSSQGMCLVSKPNSYDYWLITNSFLTAEYKVFAITSAGISAPITFTFSNTGESYQINYDKTTGKLISSGWGNKHVTLINFNSTTGVMSNEVQIAGSFVGEGYAAKFSPDGTKLYAGLATSVGGTPSLYQYNFTTSIWINMNTCCYAHDLKATPDGKMYFINTYNSSQPISVINSPNLSAVGNACNYQNLTFTPSFNGEVRRFPEFVILPQPPVANTDIVTLTGASISIPVLQNDTDPQNDPFSIDAIVQNPIFGTAVINGSNIIYTPTNASACGISDTFIYRIKDINCDFDTAKVIVNYQACTTNSCDNWLKAPSYPSSVSVGDIDVIGNQLTVEATFNDNSILNPNFQFGKLVSKHTDATNVNYSLMPITCEITTTNGYVNTPQVCLPIKNRVYHVAMVYNGSVLKFYRNGFLLSSIPWSGNLINTDLLTTIGSGPNSPASSYQQLGYINEVRIWNVARTQAELQTYMNTSLPNPTTQVGLKGYYTFDNLLNKQGNTAFNGTINGGATINATNPNCNFIADSCAVIPALPCTSWLNTPIQGAYATVGDLDITGNQITVEANFNRTQPFNNGLYPGHLVSKHTDASNDNYSLFPNGCGLTTTNGYVQTFENCALLTNKTYHVAMVYNGSTLKFYRNGYLLSSQPCSGNLINNDLLTTISQVSSSGSPLISQFLGTTNEVRIWNVARTQAELQTYMNTSLPNPTTQVGLKGYYTFDNLLNKQGNTAFNGTINGGATINATNPNCNFVVDSCNVIVPQETIINDYTPVLSLDPCKNILNVGNATAYNVGDTVLLIQMKGAVIDSTNTAAFGTITDYKSAGNYEYNYVKSKTGNQIELKNKILRTYEIPNGKVQLIRVPYYQNYATSSTLTCLPWNGTIGGVLVFNVANTLTLNNDVDVSGKGFKGGDDPASSQPSYNCGENQFYYPQNPDLASGKGEGITIISSSKSFGKGAPANGGGGGNSHNSGGGGGSNGGLGGSGGFQFEGGDCAGQSIDNRGEGGKLLIYNNASNKVFLGGGGGAGQTNAAQISQAFKALGGNGSGIIMIAANNLQANSSPDCHEGMGGGGGGGSSLLNITNYLDNISCETKGGKGGDMLSAGNLRVGPGGGGGGGILWLKQSTPAVNVTAINTGGLNGICVAYSNTAFGATPGQAGQTLFNLNLPITSIPFKPNIDSVKINAASTTCLAFNFNGLGFTNTNPIATWQWYFGDNTTGVGQNVSHTYPTSNTYTVKLVVTDINGCKDSVSRTLSLNCITSAIINDYTEVISLDPCKNILNVGNATAYNVGDTVLLIQMKGAVIDSTNTAAFGTITDYKSAGNYEYNYVKSKTGNQIELKNKILRTYEIPTGKVQLIRVPYYQNYATTSTLTCLPWNGTVGGVLVFNVANTLTLNNDVDVSGKGFVGGIYEQQPSSCAEIGFFYNQTSTKGAYKGESISELSSNLVKGRGKSANGGGGGNDHNAGGAGGANFGQGGNGGKEFNTGGSCIQQDNGGIGGTPLIYSNSSNKIFLGGGGGAGDVNGVLGGFKGGNGGGLVFISSNIMVINGNKSILNLGEKALDCLTNDCWESGSGGGSGGTVLLDVNTISGLLNVNTSGGSGGSLSNPNPAGYCAPGGGGGGGLLWLKSSTLNTNINHLSQGGIKGVFVALNQTGGSTDGTIGGILSNLITPITTIPFKPNIDSVKINATNTTCTNFNFNGLVYTNTNPITTWQWYFGDGGTATGQNTTHNYTSTNTFTVKLIVTDINGCKDSIIRNVITNAIAIDAGLDKTFCGAQTNVQLTATGTVAGTTTYAWTSIPATTITNGASLTPTANINTTTTFYCTATSSLGCAGIDSVKVIINPIPIVQTLNDIAICKGTTLQLTTTAGLTTYQWSNGIYVSDSSIANPIFSDTVPRTLIVTGSNGLCSKKDTINISIKPLPVVKTIKDTLICSTQNIDLTTTGAATYSWTPPTFLSSTISSNPTYIGTGTSFTSTTYYVTGTAANGCFAKDTVTVNMNVPNSFIDPPNKSFCKNESVQLNGNNGNSVTYDWQPPTGISNQTIINPFVSPSSSTSYTVNITDPVCNYSKLFTVVVTVNPLPIIAISKSNDITCSNPSAKLNATGAFTYTWNSSPTLSSTIIPNPVATPTVSTEYAITGVDINGCKNTNKIKVLVSSGKNIFDLPNTFTPNADTKNDCFGAINWGNAQQVFFIIYNRWGEKVFETNDINKCWDGKHNGEPAVEGNYVYYISAKTNCGDIVKKGNVLLLR
jgi:gliding motility-associated-like protein